ncbi:MAG: type VI secretion system protein TssA [Chromatiaceae bacterium]|nr:type VI secretion system protein TssA [Chromatiaceae bacterium]MCF8002716.1 type VI secretion system protein TssA [Chromatiaceae bacterium]
MIDIDGLLAEISADAPCGEDLEYGAVAELSRAAEVKSEQQIGDTFVPAEEPDWQQVYRTALKLFDETKDLRVAVILAKASARTQGWSGFRDVLLLLDALLERFWLELHPQLDEDEPDDFTLRVNQIASLADAESTVSYLRDAALIESVMGRFSLRDCLIADGELSLPVDSDQVAPERHMIEAAMRAADLDDFNQIADAISQSIQGLEGLESRLMSLVGAAAAPDLSALSALMKRAQKEIAQGMALRPDADADSDSDRDDAETDYTDGGSAKTTAPSGGRHGGPISNRDDVKRALQEICAFYRQHEPSSPIPMLLERAERLISKDFREIIEDLAPDGLSAVDVLRGVQDDYEE